MATKVKAGSYEARVLDYGVGETKEGAPNIMIHFGFNDSDGDPHEMTWFGSLKEGKAQEISLKALLTCGFTGNDPVELADGIHSGVLDSIQPVRLTIDENEYQGKRSMRILWINPVGSMAMERRLTKSDARVKMSMLNLKGSLALLRETSGSRPAPRRPEPAPAPSGFGPDFDSDIGF